MIKIAVCDDNAIDRELICYLVNEYISGVFDVEFDLVSFSNAFKLMEYFEDSPGKVKFDIYLLDVIMPSIKGIEVGSFIRKYDSDCHIIFITSSSEYALDSYDVTASGYIVKPIDKVRLFHTLDRVVSRITADMNHSKRISVKTKNGIQNIMLHTIRYAEYSEHVIYFHLVDGNVVATATGSMTISRLADMLKDCSRFVTPHRAFIVNLQYVKSCKGGTLVMDNSEQIPVSRASYGNVRKKYLEFSK